MKWIDKLEKKYRRFGIPNLTVYMIACYIIGYLLQTFMPSVIRYLSLDMAAVFRGQVWRLFTWVLSAPRSGNILLFAIAIMFFYYPLGMAMERTWGTFRYTLYIFSGLFFTVLSALILYLLTGNLIVMRGGIVPISLLADRIFTTYYISLSIFLAYAVSYPDMQILLWFVIPIKMRWMAVVYGLIIAYEIVENLRMGYWFVALPIVASLLNFVIFYLSMKDLSRYSPKDIHRRREFRKAMEPRGRSNGTPTKHKCAICGRTELDAPDMEFRFCSRCNGNYEYCSQHLFTHEHKK